jgi:hypothetical protein
MLLLSINWPFKLLIFKLKRFDWLFYMLAFIRFLDYFTAVANLGLAVILLVSIENDAND